MFQLSERIGESDLSHKKVTVVSFFIIISQVRPTHFYELDLALVTGSSSNKTVADCLKDFTKIEQMTGDERL